MVENLTEVNFKDLDFQDGIKANEKIILEALGVPPILWTVVIMQI